LASLLWQKRSSENALARLFTPQKRKVIFLGCSIASVTGEAMVTRIGGTNSTERNEKRSLSSQTLTSPLESRLRKHLSGAPGYIYLYL